MVKLQTCGNGFEEYNLTRSAKVRAGLLYISTHGGTRAFSPKENKSTITTSAGDAFSGPFHRSSSSQTGGNALTSGTIINIVSRIKITNFSGLNANQLATFAIKGSGSTSSYYNTTSTVDSIRIGVSSNGHVFLVTGNGSNVQSSDTGIIVTSGTAFTFRIVWTVGTSVALYINDTLGATNTTVIPTTTNTDAWWIGGGASTTTAPTFAFQWGAWSVTDA